MLWFYYLHNKGATYSPMLQYLWTLNVVFGLFCDRTAHLEVKFPSTLITFVLKLQLDILYMRGLKCHHTLCLSFFIVCSQVSGREGAVAIRPCTVQETALWHLVPPLPQGQEWRVSFKITAGGATVRSKETVLEVSRKTIGLTNPSQLHDWFSAADLADM